MSRLFGFLACVAALLTGCGGSDSQIVLSGPTMGTLYAVKVVAAPVGVDAAAVRVAIDDVLAQVDREMSGYRADSQIAQFNASTSTDWFPVSPQVARVVQTALEVAQSSGGAFDVTVAPLVNAWGFGAAGRPAQLPDDGELADMRRRVGHRKLQARMSPPALRKEQADLAVDLNGIAPGFAIDALAERLTAMGVENFMIDIGGEVLARGRNGEGQPWRVAVEKPLDAQPAPYAIVQLDGMSISTSGEYRQYYMRDGRRYSHTIDPRTGRPVEHELAAVVVIGATSMQVDAWTTALNVLGPEEGYALALERHMPALFVLQRDGRRQPRMTPELEKYLVVRPEL
jgi:FAD:protein FMN transferase